jgi:nucleotide sugar dehydrogenase
MHIGIIGNGFVGKATQLIDNKNIKMLVYDIVPEKCIPPNLTLNDLVICDIIFIALPTPMNKNGSCHLDIIKNVIEELKTIININTFIVLRSTVPPGTCKSLGPNIYFMPEFLTEKNWREDFINCKDWIFGLRNHRNDLMFKNKIIQLFISAYYESKIKYFNLNFVTLEEAELTKYVRNCFLAMKVSFFNEINEYAERKGIDFNKVRELVIMDERIGQSHTLVPGLDGKYGYGGTCFPKDTNALLYEMKQYDMTSFILNAVVERNEKVDRPSKDWEEKIGRTII